jgi:thiazole synthase
MLKKLILNNLEFNNRMIVGTSGYKSLEELESVLSVAKSKIVTISLRRQIGDNKNENTFFDFIKKNQSEKQLSILPNTANCRSVKEVVTTAHMAREIFQTNWIKVETIGNEYTLHPDIVVLLEATKILCDEGFEVFPYTTDDIVIAEKLVNLGCKILMPLASPIGSGMGLLNEYNLQNLRNQFPEVTLIIDAGIGAPSHAMRAMEMGFDAILLNTAIWNSLNPIGMAEAFYMAIHGGFIANNSGLMKPRNFGSCSTPNIGVPFWHLN